MIRFFKNNELLINHVIDDFILTGNKCIENKGKFYVALSGGSTPQRLFKKIFLNEDIDWTKVVFFWVDERFVPHGSNESNYGNAYRIGLHKVPAHILPFPIEGLTPKSSVEIYTSFLTKILGPALTLDYVILGAGTDGHTASVFEENLDKISSNETVLVTKHPESGQTRLTLNFPILEKSNKSILILTGKKKRGILNRIKEGHDSLPVERLIARSISMEVLTDLSEDGQD